MQSLKKLAFNWETYTPLNPELTWDAYYPIRRPHTKDYDMAKLRPDLEGGIREAIKSMPNNNVWEPSHRNRMLIEAEKYAEVMLNLGSVYLGGIPTGFKKMQSEIIRAVPLWPKMDNCITAL